MIRRFLLLCSLSLTSINASWAEAPKVVEVSPESFYIVKGVNIRNGNFSLTYKTSYHPNDPSGIPFDRIYNSMSEHKGSFGLGWGTAMDNTVSFLKGGDLVIRENGTGAFTHYKLKDDSPGQEYISREAYQQRYLIEIENEARAAREKLRQTLVEQGEILDQGPIKPRSMGPIPDGSVFIAQDAFKGDACRERSQIRREGDRMIRIFGDQCPTVSETYTLQGELINIASRQGRIDASLKFTRDPKSQMITSITDEKGKVTRFRYDAKNRLVWQEHPSGDSQKFEYDNRDNMTAILYIDDSKQTITYDEQDRALSVTPRKGSAARFEYLPDPYDPKISITRATILNGDQKDVTVFKLLN